VEHDRAAISPTGDSAAFFITRTARLNCSSSQNTITLTARARPGPP
jgi:hypothetical protein